MIDRLTERIFRIPIIHILWISVTFSVLMSAAIVAPLSVYFHGKVTADFMITGTVTSFFVSAMVSSLIVAFVRHLRAVENRLKAALEEVQRDHVIMMRSQKLAAVGTLSAGVAHEILNPLNIISTICQVLLLDERRGQIHDHLNEIMIQIQRAAKITNSLRMFAREKKFDISAVDIHALFDHTAGLLDHDLNLDNIFIDRQYDPNAPLIMADADQLAQVFMNLLTNARDVLKPRRSGLITVATKVLDNGIEFSFRDNGPGMPADVVDRIFDPFYTTKEPGSGTGLGLSITHRIIEDHGGTIKAESRQGEGTCFTIFLPKEGNPLFRDKKTDKPA